MRNALALAIVLFLAGCSTSSAYKQAVVAWDATHTPMLVHFVQIIPQIDPNARIQDLQTVSGLRCLLDEDAGIATSSTSACACLRAPSEEERKHACNGWAKGVYRGRR